MSASIWAPVVFDDDLADQLYEACGAALDALESSAGVHVTSARDKLGDWSGRLRGEFDTSESQLQQAHLDVFFALCSIRGSIATWKYEAAALRQSRARKQQDWRDAQAAIAAGRERAGLAAKAATA